MPLFNPHFQSQGIEPLVIALRDTIVATMPDALDWASPDRELPTFKKIHISEHGRVDTQFPVLAVLGLRTDELLAADDASETPTHTIQIEIALSGSDATILAQNIYRYARAVKLIIQTMTKAQITAGFDPTRIGGCYWRVTAIDYGALLRHRTMTIYRIDAALTVEITILER